MCPHPEVRINRNIVECKGGSVPGNLRPDDVLIET